jgi:hypothetical protein
MKAHPEFVNLKAFRLWQDKVLRKMNVSHCKSFSFVYVRKLVPRSDNKKKKNIDGL